jgi:hypothetical protein
MRDGSETGSMDDGWRVKGRCSRRGIMMEGEKSEYREVNGFLGSHHNTEYSTTRI